MFTKRLNNLTILNTPTFFPAIEGANNHKLILTTTNGKNVRDLIFFGNIASRAALTIKEGDEISVKVKTSKVGSRKFYHVKEASVKI